MQTIWELDFYSRPIVDDQNKKLWEVLICESPVTVNSSATDLFQYSQFCSNQTVNSIFLRETIAKAIAEASNPPQKIRFFRRQMNNMIVKACEELGIAPAPSRRTYALNQWLAERMENFYPQQPGYQQAIANFASVQYPALNAVTLPDAVRGDKGDKWAFVTLEAAAFDDMQEWDISFGEAFPPSLAAINPETRIAGLIIFSSRALPLAGWMSGLEMGFLHLETQPLPRMILETGASESWILANLTNEKTLSEAKGFEEVKTQAKGVHFLAIQSSPESESFAGFWLMKA